MIMSPVTELTKWTSLCHLLQPETTKGPGSAAAPHGSPRLLWGPYRDPQMDLSVWFQPFLWEQTKLWKGTTNSIMSTAELDCSPVYVAQFYSLAFYIYVFYCEETVVSLMVLVFSPRPPHMAFHYVVSSSSRTTLDFSDSPLFLNKIKISWQYYSQIVRLKIIQLKTNDVLGNKVV